MFVASREDQTIEVPARPNERKINRYDTHSRISLKPTAEDDYADYTCEARHEALSQDMPMRATVQLSVLCKYIYFIYLNLIKNSKIQTTWKVSYFLLSSRNCISFWIITTKLFQNSYY